jgi:hypothetical protein
VNQRSRFPSLLLVGLLVILLTNSIGYARALTHPNSALSCGEWVDDSYIFGQDNRIGVTPRGIEEDCSEMFALQNQTGSPGKLLSGYSLAITPTSNNAEVQFSQHVPILMPGLEMEVMTTPTNISIGASVLLESKVTVLSASADASLFILDTIFALVPECIPSPKDVLFISLQTAPILENVVKLAFDGDISRSLEEVSRLDREFRRKFLGAAEELGLDCIIEHYSGDLAPIVNILKPYLSWLGSYYFGYLEYGNLGVGPSVQLSYIAPAPPTITSLVPTTVVDNSLTAIPTLRGDVQLPMHPLDKASVDSVMESISYGLASGDATVFEQLIVNDYIYYGHGMSGGRNQITSAAFLSMLTERIASRPVCEGYIYDDAAFGGGTSLFVITSGWNPEWLDNRVSSHFISFTLLNQGQGFWLDQAFFQPGEILLDNNVNAILPCAVVP